MDLAVVHQVSPASDGVSDGVSDEVSDQVSQVSQVSDQVITLRSGRDDCERAVPKRSVVMSRMLSVALGSDQHAAHVTLDVSGSVLRWLAEYMHHHRDGEPDAVDFPLLCQTGHRPVAPKRGV